MIIDGQVNGKPAVLAYTVEVDSRGEVTNVMVNQAATESLTELANHGSYEIAYRGQDYLTAVYGLFFWETTGWEDLKVTHDTSVDWVTDHPIFSLT